MFTQLALVAMLAWLLGMQLPLAWRRRFLFCMLCIFTLSSGMHYYLAVDTHNLR